METSKYLLQDKLRKRFKYLCSKYNKSQEFNDIYQEYCLNILEGKSQHQTLEQFFIDYSRRYKLIKNKTCEFIDDLHSGIEPLDEFANFKNITAHMPEDKRLILFLNFKYGITSAEIADMIGISSEAFHSRVHNGNLFVKHNTELNNKLNSIKDMNRGLKKQTKILESENYILKKQLKNLKKVKYIQSLKDIDNYSSLNINVNKMNLVKLAIAKYNNQDEISEVLGISSRTLRNILSKNRHELNTK